MFFNPFLFELTRSKRFNLILSLILRLIAFFLRILSIYFMEQGILSVFTAGVANFQLLVFAALLAAISFLFREWLTKVSVKFANAVLFDLRMKLMHMIFSEGLRSALPSQTGKVVSMLGGVVSALHSYYDKYLPLLISVLIEVIISFIILLSVDFRIALMTLFCALMILLIPPVFYRLLKNINEKQWSAYSNYYASCLDSIQGLPNAKAFNYDGKRREYMETMSEDFKKTMLSSLRRTLSERGFLSFFLYAGLIVPILFFSVSLNGNIRRFILSSIGLLIWVLPLYELIEAWPTGFRAYTASRSIEAFMRELTNSEKNRKRNQVLREKFPQVDQQAPLKGDLRLEKVSFSYESGRSIFSDLSFTIPEGKTCALVGKSGIGKTSLALLLAGLLEPDEGSIFWGRQKISAAELRNNVTAVWQEIHLFQGSIKENLRLGTNDASEEEILAACQKAQIHQKIMSLKDGYNSQISENGGTFSGGERQRLALARAFLCPHSLLILDEATSSLDRHNEYMLQNNLKTLSPGMTVFCIAHRLETVKNADLIILLDEKGIAAQGKHEELLNNQQYRKLMLHEELL